MDEPHATRFDWRRTWNVGPLGVAEETAVAPGFRRLSVYRIVGGPRDRSWRWSVKRDFVPVAEGYAASRAAARRAAENAVGSSP